ncbi:hypothetical protein SNE40_010080 [Patella caerulea]|uniref:Nose resistant-to-fluoxetine protein N-terminal domain-containing protein n=1 Tax=Patella caerulea TaxID=87958 RepID=A0AAN8JV84_PATCE
MISTRVIPCFVLGLLVCCGGQTAAPSNVTNAHNMTRILTILEGTINHLPSLVFKLMKDQIPGNSTCSQDSRSVLTGLQNFEMWALEMFDSSGKLQKNILQGTVIFLGNYDKCMEINHVMVGNNGHEIRGSYAKISIKLPNLSSMKALSHLRWDLCVPKSCAKENLTAVLNASELGRLGLAISSVQFVEPLSMEADTGAIVSIVVLSVFGLLCLVGTTFDLGQERYALRLKNKKITNNPDILQNGNKDIVLKDKDAEKIPSDNKTSHLNTTVIANGGNDGCLKIEVESNGKANPDTTVIISADIISSDKGVQETKVVGPSKDTPPQPRAKKNGLCVQMLLTFSIYRNGKRILDCSAPSGTLTCLHGIRVLSMCWVILSHFLELLGGVAENKKEYVSRMQTFGFQFIINGTLSVDTFFVLSGLLVAYLFLRDCSRMGGKVSGKQMGLYYFHRYWRLTPLYAFVLLFYAHLAKYLIDGPMVPGSADEDAQNCKDNWWTNLLYINNLYKSERNAMCMRWSWYLANDMQFYIIGPLALIPLALGHRVVGFVVLAVLLAIQYITTGYTAWDIHFKGIFQRTGSGMSFNADYFNIVYVKPYTRVGVYAIGLALGYLIHKKKGKKLSKLFVFSGSVVAAALGLLATYITYDCYRKNGHAWSEDTFIAQETLYRPAFALALSWMILLCVNGYGGFVNTILSWNAWIPLSRLTYAAYLVHLIIVTSEIGSIRSLPYADMYYIINGYIGVVAVTYAVSFIASVIYEAPCLGLEKIFIKK